VGRIKGEGRRKGDRLLFYQLSWPVLVSQHRRETAREVQENSSLPLIFLYESTAGQAAQTPRATNPANTRIAVTSERISFIVVTSFLHEALRFGYIYTGAGEMAEGPERTTGI